MILFIILKKCKDEFKTEKFKKNYGVLIENMNI